VSPAAFIGPPCVNVTSLTEPANIEWLRVVGVVGLGATFNAALFADRGARNFAMLDGLGE